MTRMAMYRRWQLRSLHRNQLTLTHLVETIDDPAAFQRRDGGDEDGWTISEVLGHLCDFESYMLARARYLTGEADDEPPQPEGGPVVMVKQRGYAEQDAGDLLQRWRGLRERLFALYSGLDSDDDALWAREMAFGSGPFSLQDQLILAAMHDDDHMNQIVKIARGM